MFTIRFRFIPLVTRVQRRPGQLGPAHAFPRPHCCCLIASSIPPPLCASTHARPPSAPMGCIGLSHVSSVHSPWFSPRLCKHRGPHGTKGVFAPGRGEGTLFQSDFSGCDEEAAPLTPPPRTVLPTGPLPAKVPAHQTRQRELPVHGVGPGASLAHNKDGGGGSGVIFWVEKVE